MSIIFEKKPRLVWTNPEASLCLVPGNSLTLALGPPRLRRVKV